MRKYSITYQTLEGDTSNVWVNAYSKEEAKEEVKREYWDVQEILIVKEI